MINPHSRRAAFVFILLFALPCLGATDSIFVAQLPPPSAPSNAWWSGQTAGLIGGILGGLLGIVGATVGTLNGMGKAKKLVLTLLGLMAAGGILSLLTGIVAVVLKQPYAVYYPLLLLGAICTFVSLPLTPQVRRRYEQLELRKMQATDAMEGK